MTKKNWLSVVCLLVLAAVYVIFFTDWFKPKTVHIFHTVREMHFRRKAQNQNDEPNLIFGLSSPLKLTEITVVPLDVSSNAFPVWHLVSSSNSVPIRSFIYGQNIRGMKPALSGAHAGLLQTNQTYRIYVVAGKVHGQHDFKLGNGPDQASDAANY